MRTALISVLAICMCSPCLAADISGKWKGQLTTPNGDAIAIDYDFKQDGDKLTGTVTGPQGEPTEIAEGKVDGDKISFVLNVPMNGGTKITHTGTITADSITLAMKFGDQPMTVKLSRATP